MSSTPSSNFLSKSLAFILLHLFLATASDRDQPNPPVPVGDDSRPMPVHNAGDDQDAPLSVRSGAHIQQSGVFPQCLRCQDIATVLCLINQAFIVVKFAN